MPNVAKNWSFTRNNPKPTPSRAEDIGSGESQRDGRTYTIHALHIRGFVTSIAVEGSGGNTPQADHVVFDDFTGLTGVRKSCFVHSNTTASMPGLIDRDGEFSSL